MTRRLVLAMTLGALVLPAGSAAAGCTSTVPVSDRRFAHHQCTGVHPGMGLSVPSKKYGTLRCTAAVAFADQAGNRYLTLPGSCHLDYDCLEDVVLEELEQFLNLPQLPTCTLPSDSEEEPVYRRNGPAVHDFAGNRVGALVYAVNKDGVDFALVRADAGAKLDPRLPLYGGPTGPAATGPAVEEAYAYSAPGYFPAPNARSGLLHRLTSYTYHLNDFGLTTAPGTPVVTAEGGAVGYYRGSWTVGMGWQVLPYAPALARTQMKTGLRLTMLTAPAL